MSDANIAAGSRDDTYFLEPIFFRVEGTVFQVPRYHFASNEIFATTMTLPTGDGVEVEGSSEAKPFDLLGIAKKDFRAFLRALYPLDPPLTQTYKLTTLEWVSVLALSDLWGFTGIRDLAVEKISAGGGPSDQGLGPLQQIALGEKYRVPTWFTSGCITLIKRDKGPQPDEMVELGLARGVSIYELREMRLTGGCKMSDVRDMFGEVAGGRRTPRPPEST